jgi:hypothetical protein
MDSNATHARKLDRLVIRSGGRILFLKTAEIDWIEAAGNYLRIHCGEEVHVVRDTMAGMEARLDAARFLRIHRSTIVNVESIRLLEPCGNGEFIVQLYDGRGLSLSRTFRARLDEFLCRHNGDSRHGNQGDEGPGAAAVRHAANWMFQTKASVAGYSAKTAEHDRPSQSCSSGTSSCD